MAAKKQPNPTTAKPIKGRSGIKEQVLTNDPTRDYVSTKYQYYGDMFIHQLPLWRLWTGKMMLTSDPIINFSLNIRNAALGAADVTVTGPNPRVVDWVQKQWDFLWNNFREKLVSAKKYGFSPLQIIAKADRQGLVTIKGLKDFDPVDCRALELNGRLVGQSVKGAKVYFPQALWLNFGAEYGNYYGTGVLRRQYPAWYEKWMDHGAKRLLQLRMIKDSYIGDIFWYPPNLLVELPDGTKMSWRDMMREIGENRLSGGALTLPRFVDNNGKELTGYTPPQDTGGGSQIFEWVETCDNNILRGADVPSEVVQAADTGSGFSGRSIPFLVVLSVCTEELVQIVRCVNEQILRPLAWVNFGGEPEYEIKPMSLVESFGRDLTGSPMAGSSIGTTPGQGQPVQIQQHSEATELNQDHLTSFQNGLKQKLGLKSLWLWHDPSKKNIKLDSIQVHKHQQGQGIGSQAMREITSLADKHGHSISLTTGVRDPSMGTTSANRLKRFYSRFGFKKNKDLSLSANMYRAPNSQHSEEPGLPPIEFNNKDIQTTKLGKTTFQHRIDGDQVSLYSMRTPQQHRRQGHATRGLKHFLKESEKTGLPVRLYASALDKKTNDGKLVAFYKKHGFTETGKRTHYGAPELEYRHGSQHSEEQFGETPAHEMTLARFTKYNKVKKERLEEARNAVDPIGSFIHAGEKVAHRVSNSHTYTHPTTGKQHKFDVIKTERTPKGHDTPEISRYLMTSPGSDVPLAGVVYNHKLKKVVGAYNHEGKIGAIHHLLNHVHNDHGKVEGAQPMSRQGARAIHRFNVHKALEQGKYVPKRVLKDYPNLEHQVPVRQTHLFSESKPSYSSTQFNIPEPVAWKIIELAKLIPDEDLVPTDYGNESGNGRELQPHVTVKYGLHTDDPQDVRRVVADASPIAVTLGEVTTFSCERYDVVKIDVQSKGLHALNKLISDSLEHTDTYPDYKPHITLAYVKSGEGEKWAKRLSDKLIGKAIAFDTLIFSDKNRNHTEIKLGGESQFNEVPHGFHHVPDKVSYRDKDDEYLYHVTPHPHKVIAEGLHPNKKASMTAGFYRQYSKGKAFLTERSKALWWKDRIDEHLEHEHDEPPPTHIVRIHKSKVSGHQPDEVGNKDAGGGSHYVTQPVGIPHSQHAETSPCEPFCEPVEQYGELPRVFYRGTVPGETKRIDEPFESCKGKTFCARKPESAKAYGHSVEEIHAHPDAKILHQEHPHFWKLLGHRKPANGHIASAGKNGAIHNVNKVVTEAGKAGYHAVSFSHDSDIGTVILDESKFHRKPHTTQHAEQYGEFVPREHTVQDSSPDYPIGTKRIGKEGTVDELRELPTHKLPNPTGNKLFADKVAYYVAHPTNRHPVAIDHGTHFVVDDGNHRIAARKKTGHKTTKVWVRKATEHQYTEQYGERPRVLYRGVMNSGIGAGTYSLGKGLYSTTDRGVLAGLKFDKIVTLHPDNAYPTRPLRLPSASHFPDWLLSKSGHKNIRDFNKEHADPGVFVRKHGYDGVHAGNEVVRYSDDEQHAEQYGEILSPQQATELVNKIRTGDARSKHKGISYGSAIQEKEAHTHVRLPLSSFSPHYVQYLRESTDPERVASYKKQKIDTPIHAVKNRKGNWVLHDGGHRTVAAIERGDTHINALVPVSHAAQHAEQYGEHIIGYHAPTKGEFAKPDTSRGSDADIMGKGFYFGTKEYASKYGTPKPYKIRGNFASGYAWIAALAKHSKKPIEHQRAAARADLQKKGYHGVHNGTVGVVWHDHLITPHEENQHAEQFSETDDVKRLREFIQKGMAARIQEASTRILKLKQTFLDKPTLLGEIEREILALRPLLQDSFSAVNYVATLDGMAEIIGITPPVSTKEQPTATDVPSLSTALFNGTKPEHLPESIEALPILKDAVATLEASPAATGINYKETAELVRQGSFAVTAELTDHAVADLRDILAESMSKGDSRDEFIDTVYTNLTESGKLSEAHLENIFRTNVLSALSAGKAKAMEQPIVADAFPYVVYYATRDARVRKEHIELETLGLNGTAFYRFDDPVFKTFRPPWSWQCRCRWYPQTAVQAAAKGVKEAIDWLERAKQAAQEKGGSFYEYLNSTAPANPEFVPMPDFQPPPEFHRTPN